VAWGVEADADVDGVGPVDMYEVEVDDDLFD
jgi:hypothetical protein